jgi:thioredoxin 1
MKFFWKVSIAAGCLLGVLAAFYGFGFFGKGTPVKENEVAAEISRSVQPGLSGRVTMIDLGASECVPCKMMAPILEELEKEYAGIADIVFIDIWQNPAEGRYYRIKAIPTQIFFDVDGKEVSRHVGFMDKQQIIEKLTGLGAIRPAPGSSPDLPNREG